MSVTEDEGIGHRVRLARKTHGLTQQQLADRAHISKSLIDKVERGERAATFAFTVAIARAMNVERTALTGQPYHSGGSHRIHDAIPPIERALMSYDLPMLEDSPRPRPIAEIGQDVAQAAELRMAARYTRLGEALPSLLDELTVATRTLTGSELAQAFWYLAVAYRCADALANKLGYMHLSYLAVHRVEWAAKQSEDPLMVATSAYLRGQACMDLGQYEQGLYLLDKAGDDLESHNMTSRSALAVRGTLHLRSAVTAARAGAADTAIDHIAEATGLARLVGRDVTDYWTLFGPTNVGIHAVAAAVELGDWRRAIDEADRFSIPANVPAERVSHHYIDLARAYLWATDREEALTCLLKAERIAPQHTHYHPMTREVVRVLVEQARRAPETLLGLAARTAAGI